PEYSLVRRLPATEPDRDPRRDAAVARQPVHGVRDLAAKVRCNPLAVDDLCQHAIIRRVCEAAPIVRTPAAAAARDQSDEPDYPMAQISSSTAACVAPAP